MFYRKRLVTAFAAVALGLATAASIRASVSDNYTMYLTFSQPVSLPGVALGSGTYIFELLDHGGHNNVVRVVSRDRKTNYFMGLTYSVNRPPDLKRDQLVSFAEASPNVPQPIAVWWPEASAGRQFIYPKK
jgi:hypothetical protein